MASSPRIAPEHPSERSSSPFPDRKQTSVPSQTPKPLGPADHDQAATRDIQPGHDASYEKETSYTSGASHALGRYLAHSQSHEMMALGLAAFAAPPKRYPVTPERDKEGKTPGRGSSPMLSRENTTPPSMDHTMGPIEPDSSISLSPSPPACPSPEHDADANLDVRGLALKLKRVRESKSGRGRMHKAGRRRRREEHDNDKKH